MILIEKDHKHFRYRVAGIALKEGKVLLYRHEDDGFWSIPGGVVDLMENSEDTLIREYKEEVGADIRIDRLAWVLEFFYKEYEEIRHELSLYYLVKILENSEIKRKDKVEGNEGKERLIFRWFPFNDLNNLVLHPKFLNEKLRSLREEIEHIVYSELKPGEGE